MYVGMNCIDGGGAEEGSEKSQGSDIGMDREACDTVGRLHAAVIQLQPSLADLSR